MKLLRKHGTYIWALEALGFKPDHDLKSKESYNAVHARWKERVIKARNEGNDNLAAELSLYKSLVQKRHFALTNKFCPNCGKPKNSSAELCSMCRWSKRHGQKLNPQNNMALHSLESPTLIPPIQHGFSPLHHAMTALSKGNIGDSFVTDQHTASIRLKAKTLGGLGKIIMRLTNPGAIDRKERRRMYRVWRTDGLSDNEVNEQVTKRLSGQKIPLPAPWVPMPLAEVKKLYNKERRKR